MSRRSKTRALIGFLAALMLLAPMMMPGGHAVAQTGGKVLRVQQPVFPDVIDPQKASFASEIAVLTLNYEGLTRQDSNLKLVGAAAESWEFSQDGLTLTFHLRHDLKYSDGSTLNASNFVYAIQRNCDPRTAGQYQSITFEIVGCEDFANTDPADATKLDAAAKAVQAIATDDNTLTLTLTHPAPYFPTVASLWVFYPVKQELVEKGGDAWYKDPKAQIGNGPFQMTTYDDGQEIDFVANKNYWAGSPKLDGINYIYQKESSLALEAYKNGDLDIMTVDPQQIPVVKADATLSKEFQQYPVANSYNLNFNLAMKPFDDIKVREAFSEAFDRKTYCEVIRNGDCTPTTSWIPVGLPGSVTTDKYGFDPDAAKAALAASSYGSADKLPPITMYYNSNDTANTARAEWVAGQYRDILGVTITLAPTEGTALTALRKDPKTFPQMLLVGGWIQDYPDPQNWLSVYWKCDATFAKRFSYCNPEFDKVVNQADVELDPAKRIQLYEQASNILIDDIPGPFLYNTSGLFLVKPNVTGATPTVLDVNWPGQFTELMNIDITS
jgi:oligopeptide transport system substrate-binding protein